MSREAKARARSNIALAKYWGKSDRELNLPAVPSISLSLAEATTETRVIPDAKLKEDMVILNDQVAGERERARVVQLLDQLRSQGETGLRVRVESANNFPTAAGLASSASGFAALAAAGAAAFELPCDEAELSRIARRASASAARSIFGGFVELPAGKQGDDALAAVAIASAEYWPLKMVVAVVAEGAKAVGSTEGMERSRKTSPFYSAWLEAAPQLTSTIRRALLARDLDRLGEAMEQSTFAFHCCAISASPALFYWRPETLAVINALRSWREKTGISAYMTMDAGPHVKVLCRAEDSAAVMEALTQVPGVLRTLLTSCGPGIEVWT